MGGANAKSKRAAKLSNALDYAWLMDTTPPRPCEKNRHFRRISNISTIIYTLFALHECCPELPREVLPSIVLNMQIRVPYSYSSMFSLSAVKHLDSAQKIVLLGSGCGMLFPLSICIFLVLLDAFCYFLRLIVFSFSLLVGKSAVVIQFIQNYFDGSYEGTESVDYYRKTMTIDGKTAAMDIYDIGSTPSEYNKEMREAICAGEAFIVCYSVTNRESFERVRGIIDDVYVKKNNVDVVPLSMILILSISSS
jgi:hypothetical protein